MSPQEFKAWFEGFSEQMEGAPNKKQWTRIKEKIALISDVQIVIGRQPSWYPIWYNSYPLVGGFAFNSVQDHNVYSSDMKTTITCDSSQFLLDTAKDIGRQEYVK